MLTRGRQSSSWYGLWRTDTSTHCRCAVSRSGSVILCYHRVAEGVDDPFRLCVTPANFAVQLDEIARYGEPSTIAELSVPSRRPRVVVTFDDGYADNLTNALPIAKAKAFPITVFVTSGVVGDHRGFWWDRLATLLRSRPSGIREFCLPAERANRPHRPRCAENGRGPPVGSSAPVTASRSRRSTASSMPSRSSGRLLPILRPMLDR